MDLPGRVAATVNRDSDNRGRKDTPSLHPAALCDQIEIFKPESDSCISDSFVINFPLGGHISHSIMIDFWQFQGECVMYVMKLHT